MSDLPVGADAGPPTKSESKTPTLTIVKSVAWNSFGNTFGIICTMASLVVMSRLLTPTDFGLFGIAMVVFLIAEGICNGGGDALIQQENATKDHCDTMFTCATLVACFIFMLIYFSAPWIANVFGQPALTDLLRVLSFALVLGPVSQTSAALLIRDLEFRKITMVDVTGTVIPAIIGITLAFYFQSAWALVWLEISRRIIRSSMFIVLAKYVPRIQIHQKSFHDLFSFTAYTTLLGLTWSVQRAMPGAIIGWAMGAAPLGLFNMALRFFEQAQQALIRPFGAVVFPVFAKAQSTREELHKVMQNASTLSMFLIFPAFVGAIVVAPLLVPLLLGHQWVPAVPAMQLAFLLGPLAMLEEINNNLLKGIGRPALIARITFISMIFTAIGVILVSGLTIEAVMGILIGQKLLAVVLTGVMAKQYVGYAYLNQITPLIRPAAATAVMAAVVWGGLQFIGLSWPTPLRLLALVGMGVATYFLIVRLIAPELVATGWRAVKGQGLQI